MMSLPKRYAALTLIVFMAGVLSYQAWTVYQNQRIIDRLESLAEKNQSNLDALPKPSQFQAKTTKPSKSLVNLLNNYGSVKTVTIKNQLKQSSFDIERRRFPDLFNAINRSYTIARLSVKPSKNNLSVTLAVERP